LKIKRETDEPFFYDFALRYAIVSTLSSPESKMLEKSVQELTDPIAIPTFQRSIVWKKEQVKELVDTKSAMYGTAILAKYGEQPVALIDGLQRFATATALLIILYKKVISPDPTNEKAAVHFTKLRAKIKGMQPVIEYNDKMLKGGYVRRSLNNSYKKLVDELESYIDSELEENSEKFAQKIQRMFLEKQIGIDFYKNFDDYNQLTHTFITLNSTGIDLSPVDLLRAKLVDHVMLLKWDPNDIEDMENHFTETFDSDSFKPQLKVLGTSLNEIVEENPKTVFPNWDKLKKNHVDSLLDFIDNAIAACKDVENYPYFSEIIQCGGFPFSITLLFFYKFSFLKNKISDFAGGELDSQYECRLLLQVFFRRLINGDIGRLGSELVNMLKKKDVKIAELVEEINPSSAGPANKDPENSWLNQRLREGDSTKSKRVFNACLLPERTNSSNSFKPLVFGTSEGKWAIDHLIPKKKLKENEKGEHEINRLPNFSPLTSDKNREAKNLPCSDKLRSHSIFAGIHRNVHPYIDWLITEHLLKYDKAKDVEINKNEFLHPLDAQLCLQPNAKPSIGDERIAAIAKIISTKI